MNKKQQTSTHSDIKGLIPELRFPEFENSGRWVSKTLGSIAINLNSKRIPITSNIREKGNIPYYGATGVIDYVKNYIFNEELLLISEDGANLLDRNYPIAYSISGKAWVNNHAHVLKFKNKSTEVLVQKYINSKSIEVYLTGKAQPKLNRKNLDRIRIPLAVNPKEQQKIANCLSSLDDVINAETEKLDLLQDHKKGLLQQLFPQQDNVTLSGVEGQPKYRFPEFVDDGDWDKKQLGNISQITTGRLDANAMVVDGKYRFYTCAKNYYYINNYAFDTEALLISGNGANVGYIHYYKGKFNAYQRTYILDGFNENIIYVKYFLEYNLSKRIAVERKEGNTPYIVKGTLSDMIIFIPKNQKEQQKIANCLSSVDELIASQQQKIEGLKAHKKGLLQKLFPTIKN